MNFEKFYKSLILFLILLQLLWFFIPWDFAYPDNSVNALMWLGTNSIIESHTFIIFYSNTLITLYLIAYIGLLFYNRTAKLLYFILVIGNGLASPLFGISVQSGYESLIGYFLVIGDGMILCMILFTSISQKFEKPLSK